jgi:hypothetical protein
MKFKTTLVLLGLVLAAGLGWLAFSLLRSDAAAKKPPEVLDRDVKEALLADKSKEAVKIVLEHGGQKVELNRPAGETAWSMPGNWPPDTTQVKELIRLLAGMKSRFVAIPVKGEGEWSDYGLEKPLVTVRLRAGTNEQTLQFGRGYPSRAGAFGREDEPGNTFYQATYLRRGKADEVIQLEPGLAEKLRRPRSAFMQNWLILPEETVIKSEDKPDKGKKVAVVKAISFTDKQGGTSNRYTLRWTGSAWELSRPVHDKVEPEKVKAILKDLPDIWAERFVSEPDKGDKFGLKKPEQELSVTRADGKTVTVQVGKPSRVVTRTTSGPPPRFGMPPTTQTHRETYHYARLKGNAQVFEVNIDKLKSLSVPLNTLRDPSVVKFKSEDAKRLEVNFAGRYIVLARPKDNWVLEKPTKYDADSVKVSDLLNNLSGLQVKDHEIIDPDPKDPNSSLKAYGLDKPAGSVTVSLEDTEDKGGKNKPGKRQVKLLLGKHDKEAKKLYVRVEGQKRIAAVDGELFDLARRPALAYRGKNIFKFSTADLAKVEVDRPGDPFTLEAAKDDWRMTTPVKAGVDGDKARKLAGDLGTLEVVDFVADNVAPKALDETYGLAKPALTVKLAFKDAKKQPLTLSLGKKRPGQLDYYAKLASDPAVFAVKEELFTTLDTPSLSYRSLDLWKIPADEVTELRLEKAEGFRLRRDGQKWRVTAPFEAAAGADRVLSLTAALADLRAESFKEHAAKNLARYGLDKPYLRLTVTVQKKDDKKGKEKVDKKGEKKAKEKVDKKDDKKGKEKVDKKGDERELLVGNPVVAGDKSRFAKLGDSPAVFVLSEATVAVLDRSPYELLDRTLLSLVPGSFRKVENKAGDKVAWSAEYKGKTWQVSQTPAGDFAADAETLAGLVSRLANLRVRKFEAYGPKVDLDKYGLKKPAFTLTFMVEGKDKKKTEHTLRLGAEVKGGGGGRYALLDKSPGVGVLGAPTVKEVTQGHLALVNRTLLEFKADAVTALEREAGKETLEVRRAEGGT